MSITISVGTNASNDITITDLIDLKNDASTLLKLAEPVVALLDKPVSAIPSSDSPITVNYQSGNNSWTVGNFTFGLSGGVSGSIKIFAPGQDLFSYTGGFATTIGQGLQTVSNATTTGKITAGANQYYVCVELDLTLAANAAARVQLGAVGIAPSAGTSDTFKVDFFKTVSGTTLFKDAVAAAFAGFVLPLHSQTYQHMQPGDYLYHQFNATLNVGFGATFGLDQVLFSGQYKADIPSAPAAPSVNTSAKVEVKAGATLGVTFKYTGSFEAFMWKVDANTGRLHLYKNQTTDVNFNFGGTITVIADPTVSISSGNLSTLVTQVLPGTTGSVVNDLLTGKAQSELNKWVNDLQTKLTNWLKPFQQGKTALQVAIDDTHSSFLLMDYTFDLTAIGFPAAWSKAIAGDYNGALEVPDGGASLDPGSGLEDFHTQTTSVSLNLFGKFQGEWTTAHIDNYSVIYAGNNTFHLTERIGVRETATLNGRGREVDLYFAAAATSTPAGVTLGDVDLYILLKATNNPNFGKTIAGFLSKAATGPDASELSKQVLATAQQSKAVETLELIFKPSAYGRLTSSTLQGNKIVDEAADQNNYQEFASACSQFETALIANFQISNPMDLNYGVWRTWNITANDGSVSSTSVPSRIHSGNTNPGGAAELFIENQFGLSQSFALIAVNSLEAASKFMNICADLKNLASIVEANSDSWAALRSDLGYIIKSDVPYDFLIPTAYALAVLMGQSGLQPSMSGPATGSPLQPSIAVTAVYS